LTLNYAIKTLPNAIEEWQKMPRNVAVSRLKRKKMKQEYRRMENTPRHSRRELKRPSKPYSSKGQGVDPTNALGKLTPYALETPQKPQENRRITSFEESSSS